MGEAILSLASQFRAICGLDYPKVSLALSCEFFYPCDVLDYK